jgi:anion-transporting  ArsA/GET3 family ATPase
LTLENLKQRLLFIVGKGGVGRSTISASLAAYFSQKKENVLVVQWSLSDSISPIFSDSSCGHKENLICLSSEGVETPSFKVMNFNVDEAIKEYFVDHLKMKILYSLIIQNKHVQKLVHAAPGIAELFFLGRLFWLVELAQKEKGIFYDRVIVDTPATGHGVSLFSIAKTVANLGMTGPLAAECERVAKLLGDKQKTAVFLVTLPEELPAEECMESVPKILEKLGYAPAFLMINQSIEESLFQKILKSQNEPWMKNLLHSLNSNEAEKEFRGLTLSLLKRNSFQKKLEKFAHSQNIKTLLIPDFNLTQKQISPLQIIECLSNFFDEQGC